MSEQATDMQALSAQFQQMVDSYLAVQCRYQAAIRQVRTKLEILDEEFQSRHQRNPIHSMQCRMKSLQSIITKLERKHFPVDMPSAESNLTDIAGIRVVCAYLSDVYVIAGLLTGQDDVRVVRTRDYICEPKPNGYRSLHLIVEVPVYLAEGKLMVPVEIQIRTIAMDFWASLEHQLHYKSPTDVPARITDALTSAAEDAAALDERMQHIYDELARISGEARA